MLRSTSTKHFVFQTLSKITIMPERPKSIPNRCGSQTVSFFHDVDRCNFNGLYNRSCLVFKLQQEAPKCNAIRFSVVVDGCPPYYGSEYHGAISHKQAAKLLLNDGDYLIRLSPCSDNFYTLSLKYSLILRILRTY